MHEVARADQYAFWSDWVHRSERWEVNRDNERRGLHVLSELPAGRQGLRILDVGCGSGWLARELVRHGQVTATDLASDAMAKLAREHPHICWVGGDFMTVLRSEAPFDFVTCLETIAHVPDQPGFARRLAELTCPGGTLVLTTQNAWIWNRTSHLQPPGPGQIRNWPSRERLVELFSPFYELAPVRTCAPGGDRGLPLLLNNRVVRVPMELVLGRGRWAAFRERVGLGRSLVLVGRRRS